MKKLDEILGDWSLHVIVFLIILNRIFECLFINTHARNFL